MAMLVSPLPGPYDKRNNAPMVGVRQPGFPRERLKRTALVPDLPDRLPRTRGVLHNDIGFAVAQKGAEQRDEGVLHGDVGFAAPGRPGNGETWGFCMAVLVSPLPGPYDKRNNAPMVGVRQPGETSQETDGVGSRLLTTNCQAAPEGKRRFTHRQRRQPAPRPASRWRGGRGRGRARGWPAPARGTAAPPPGRPCPAAGCPGC